MNDPAVILTMLILALIGEGVLWTHRKDQDLSRWKYRACLYGIGIVVLTFVHFQPVWGIRFDLILYAVYLLLIVLLVGVYFVASRLLRGVNRVLMRSQELHGLGRTREAIDVLQSHRRKAARFDRNTESVLLTEMARLAVEINDMDAAERFLSEAESLSEQNQAVYGLRSDLLARAGDHDAACGVLKRGLERLPKSVWLHTVLAEQLADAGRNDEAREVLVRTVELMEGERFLDVADPVEWQEMRIGPLLKRLGSTPQPLVTGED